MWRFLCPFLFAVFCVGCTKFDHPLVAEEAATPDARLLGNWIFENEEGRCELQVRADGRAAVVTTTAAPPDEETHSGEIRFVTARVGRRDYGSARGGELPQDTWTMFRYEIRHDQVEIVFFDDEQWNRAVERGELPGTLEKSWKIFAHVSASPEQLRAWLGKHSGAVRKDPYDRWIFRRAPAN